MNMKVLHSYFQMSDHSSPHNHHNHNHDNHNHNNHNNNFVMASKGWLLLCFMFYIDTESVA